MSTIGRIRLQLTLRDLLIVVAIIGVGLGMAMHFMSPDPRNGEFYPIENAPRGYEEGLLTSAGLLLTYAAVRFRPPHWRRLIRGGLLFTSAVLIWFAAIDYSRHIEWCQHCDRHVWTEGIRLYHLPIRSYSAPHQGLQSDVADDLGVPCNHLYQRQETLRYWGLLFLKPGASGICCITDDGDYADIQPYVRQMARENPDLPAEFHRKAFIEHDRIYLQKFFAEVQARRDSKVSGTLDTKD